MSTVLLHAIYTHITYMHAHVYIQSTNNQCNSMHQKEFANPSQYTKITDGFSVKVIVTQSLIADNSLT